MSNYQIQYRLESSSSTSSVESRLLFICTNRFRDKDDCCYEDKDSECCRNPWPNHILETTKETTRIYIFFGESSNLLQFMDQMSANSMLVDGKYMVIYVTPETLIPKELPTYLWGKDFVVQQRCEDLQKHNSIHQWKSLIVVGGTPYR